MPQDEECRETRLLALGELRRGDVGALLLGAAARGGRAGLAALRALEAGPRAQRLAARRPLAALALGLRAPAAGALPLRAAAARLLLRDGPAAAAALAAELRAAGPRELRRVCWQTLQARAPPSEPPPPALDPRPRDWCKRAYDGTRRLPSFRTPHHPCRFDNNGARKRGDNGHSRSPPFRPGIPFCRLLSFDSRV